MRWVGTIDNGRVGEHRVVLDAPDGQAPLEWRRIRLDLKEPTRAGGTTLYLLTTVPAATAEAGALAARYQHRWTLEKAFLHLTVPRRCEITTLGYPKTARFGLAVAVVAYNGLAVVKAARRRVHGAEALDEGLSGYYLVHEMANVAASLDALMEPSDWAVFQTLPWAAMVAWLVATAERVQRRQYRQPPRRSKKRPGRRVHNPTCPPVSVARVLAARKTSK